MTQGPCPVCGAPVEFSAGAAQVLVCPHCQAVVARKDFRFESLGKVAALLETDSPLRLGLEGSTDGKPWRVAGHLQKSHGAGFWDEWFLQFDDGSTGWLSESEGAFHLLQSVGQLPQLKREDFPPGRRFTLKQQRLVVEERNHARIVAAAGQFQELELEAEGHYVDATGPNGVFATLDFGSRSEGADIFFGRKLPLQALGIPADQIQPRVRKVSLQAARCTECNGPLELRAPDASKRVACPYCGALLDCSQGRLAFLQALEKPKKEPRIPLGAKGSLANVEWTCIGHLVRSCTVDGVRYPWGEYLLYNKEHGFTWLMESNGHWVYLVPLEAGDVAVGGSTAVHQGRRYRAFQKVTAVTEAVLGEFYWEVQAGEKAHATEYVAAPYSVNVDATDNEVTYTHGEYLDPEVVKQAFQLKGALPKPRGIAPSQPNPHEERYRDTWGWTKWWAAGLVALFLWSLVGKANTEVLVHKAEVSESVTSGTPAAMSFSKEFVVPQSGNVQVVLDAPVDNEWLGVQGELVNEDTGEVVAFYSEVAWYRGVEDGESWSEGEQRDISYLSAVAAGRYVLRTTAFFDAKLPTPGLPVSPLKRGYQVRLISDVPRWTWFFWALGFVLVGPLWVWMRHSSFETERWSESNLSE